MSASNSGVGARNIGDACGVCGSRLRAGFSAGSRFSVLEYLGCTKQGCGAQYSAKDRGKSLEDLVLERYVAGSLNHRPECWQADPSDDQQFTPGRGPEKDLGSQADESTTPPDTPERYTRFVYCKSCFAPLRLA